MADATKPMAADVLYEGDASFDGQGHATVSVEEFNRLAAAAREAGRLREGLERMTGGRGNMTVFGSWPWALSNEQCAVAYQVVEGCTKIAQNLLDGKTWNGEEAGG